MDRRRARFFGLGVSVLLATLLSSWAPALAQAPVSDSATGSGTFAATTFEGSAVSGPNGENPTGFVRLSGFYNFEGTVTCLNVSGTRAVIGYRIETGSTAGQGFLVEIADNGPTPPGGTPTDQVISYSELPAPPVTCPAPSLLAGGTLTSGDFVVIDATTAPIPTSKEQCKRGGWRDLVDGEGRPFTNQGSCTAFVDRRR